MLKFFEDIAAIRDNDSTDNEKQCDIKRYVFQYDGSVNVAERQRLLYSMTGIIYPNGRCGVNKLFEEVENNLDHLERYMY